MNLQYLKSFYVTAKYNSISKAAQALFLSQPGLSMQLRALEKELGASLLERSNKGVELTEAGRILFDYADTLLSIQDNIERDLENLKNSNSQLLLGACMAIGEYALPCSVYLYKQANKNIDIKMDISNSKEVLENLLNKSINIGILQHYRESDDIQVRTVTECPLYLVASAGTTKTTVSLVELVELPLIMREDGSGTKEELREALARKDVRLKDLNVIYQLNSMEAIKSSVISNRGMAFLPEIMIQRELRTGTLHIVKIEDTKIVSKFHIAYRKEHPLSASEREFIDFVGSSKRGFC